MYAAMRWVTDAWPIALAGALIWGAMILALDRWLVTSVSGTTSGVGRLTIYVPRIVMATLVSVVIAEPLILAAFKPAIEQQVTLERMRSLQENESMLRLCNPVPGTAEVALRPDPANCRSYRLAGPDPGADLTALTGYEAMAASLQKEIDARATDLDRSELQARRECNGTDGGTLTGRAGVGPNCVRLRAAAGALRAEQSDEKKRLSDLRRLIEQKQATLLQVQKSAAEARTESIRNLVQQQRAAQGPIGLLERLSALQRLGDQNGYVVAATWLVRLMIMLIDVLPALARLVMGTTAYDRIVAHHAEVAVRTQFAVAENRSHLILADEQLARERKELEIAVQRERIELEAGIDRLLVDSRRAGLISRRATELRGAGRSLPAADVSDHDQPSIEP
jgi:hypothetical protein